MNWVLKNIIELFYEYNVHSDESVEALAEDCCHVFEEYAEKYRWHNLRKNPEDLPKDMENVQICWIGGSNNWYDSMFWDADRKVFSINSKTEYEIIHPVIGDDRYTNYGQAIAWRYIEPFEEVE